MIKIYQMDLMLPEFYLVNKEEIQSVVDKYKGLYTHVANIHSPNTELEEVFSIANEEDSPHLEVLSNNYHSLSVGDIINISDDRWYCCAPAGWYSIEGIE